VSSSSPIPPEGDPESPLSSDASAGEGALVIRGARILVAPDAAPIDRGTVLVRKGRISKLGDNIAAPSTAREIDGAGRVLTAGFWNSHVHFTEPKWRRVRAKDQHLIEAQLYDMFTSRGFTTVVDTGSDPRRTLQLRHRIEYEAWLGPRIYTAGSGLYPPHGIPHYVRATVPVLLRPLLPTPPSPRLARRAVERNFARGVDLIKLFTGSYVEPGKVRPMPEPIARAAVEAAHEHGVPVFSHPSNLEGTRVAVRAGVDVLAHPPDMTEGVDEPLLREMADRRMSMVPTLQMFERTVSTDRSYLEPIYDIVRRFHALGGSILFGTDVGYMTDYSIEGELRAMLGCGLTPSEILRSLTSAPAERFGVGDAVGTVVPGARADLVLLDADPLDEPLALTRVYATVRGGRVLHLRP